MRNRHASWIIAALAELGSFLALGISQTLASEPIMDTGVFGVSRSVAVNQVKEGKFHEAVAEEEKALKIAEDRYGPVHPSLVPIFNDMASLHRFLAEYGKAEEEIKWGLALREKNLGPDDLTVADSLDQLASLYNDLGRFQEAEIMEKKSLSIRQQSPAQNLSAMAQTLSLLGRIEINLDKMSLAQSVLEKAIATLNQDPHADTVLTVHLLNSLAETYQLEGLFPKAESTLQKALSEAQKNFPSDDVQVADAMENLADFHHSQNQEDKAKPLYDSALKIDKPFVGTYAQYPALPYMKRLAKAYQGVGSLQAAEDLCQKIVKTEKGVFGLNHPQVALGLMRLGEVEEALGKRGLAKENLRQSIEILDSFFKAGHPLLDQAHSLLEKFSKED